MKWISADFETYLIGKPDVIPKPVCLSVDDGEDVHLVLASEAPKFFAQWANDPEAHITFHNASFDLSVAIWWLPESREDIFKILEEGRFHCTMLREQLKDLSTLGEIDYTHSLSKLAKKYLGRDLDRWKKGTDIWRLRYSELDGIPIENWPQAAVDYAVLDAEVGRLIALEQEAQRADSGYGSINTESLQVRAAVSLALMTGVGLDVDQEQVKKVSTDDLHKYALLQERLIDLGYATRAAKTGKISFKQKQFRDYLQSRYPDQITIEFKKSDKTGKINESISLQLEDLEKISFVSDDVLETYIEFCEYKKNCETYYPRLLGNRRVYPVYNPLVKTGRTSCRLSNNFPSVQIQNQPRKPGVRECYVPPAGELFIITDLAAIELCSVANTLYVLFGESKLRDMINEGYDIHSVVGSKLMGISYDEFVKRRHQGDKEVDWWRTVAKPVDLGYPGGLGPKTMRAYAKSVAGVDLTLEQAREFRKKYFEMFPEIEEYHKVATKRFGYIPQDSDRDRRNQFYETNGRHRNRCTFCEHVNGFTMQSPTADAAKECGFALTKEMWIDRSSPLFGSRTVFFVHDEYGSSTSVTNLEKKVERHSEVIIDATRIWLPHVRITVETQVADRWRKKGPFLSEDKFWKEAMSSGNNALYR